MHFINQAKLHDTIVELFWDTGYPFENAVDSIRNVFTAMQFTMKFIQRKDKVALWSEPIFISPGSIVDRFSEKFGVKVKVKTFKDQVAFNRASPMRLPPFDTRTDYLTNAMPRIAASIMNKLMLPLNFISFFPAILVLASKFKEQTSRPGMKQHLEDPNQLDGDLALVER
jgi:hypothetical protein